MALDGELNDVPVRPKGPRPHRCNDRIEDLLEAILTLDFGGKIRPAWKVLRLCLNSAPGYTSPPRWRACRDFRL
eukprot:jgi/Botrbrau1/16213/Bobra.0066s0002.3